MYGAMPVDGGTACLTSPTFHVWLNTLITQIASPSILAMSWVGRGVMVRLALRDRNAVLNGGVR
jgi:hypothetical protein